MKVTLITIVYNNSNTIEKSIESVLSQTYPNIEYIVIDGGSTDGTQNIIEKYKADLAYYISEKDSGMYNALNKGIKRATGDIVGLLHADDTFFDTSSIQKIVTAFKTTKAQLVYGKGIYIDRENEESVKRIYPSKDFRKRFLYFGWIPLHTTIFVRNDLFKTYGLYDESYQIASDYEISLRWFTNPQITKVYMNEWLVKMRLGGKSTTAALQKQKSSEDLQIILKYGLLGTLTLFFKILRKIPQYILPRIRKFTP